MYKINGTDLFSSCGFIADSSRESSNSIERPADPAEVFSHTWPDGTTEYDLVTVPGKKARTFKLTGYITAVSEADYIFKKQTFEALIRVQIATIYNEHIGVTVNAKLNKIATWERLTAVKGASNIITRVSVEFNELLGVALPVYGLYYGSSASVPLTATEVQSLNTAVFANEVTTDTGVVNRVISIAIQSDKSITSVNDLDDPLFGTVVYSLKGTVTIGAANFNVYSLELGAPYSTNHRHKFIIA